MSSWPLQLRRPRRDGVLLGDGFQSECAPLGQLPRGATSRRHSRQAHLHDNQTVELKVIPEGVLIRPVQPRLSLAERLAAYGPMPGEPREAMAWDPIGAELIE